MNWNSYDTKYIIKRLIIGFGMLILFSLLTTHKAKAYTVDTGQIPDYTYTLSTHEEEVISITSTGLGRLENKGKGTLYFSLLYYNTNADAYLNPIIAVGIDTGNKTFQCDIGNQVAYNDEGNKKNTLISAVCPVDFTNTGVRGIRIKRGVGNVSTSIVFSTYMTLFNDTNSTSSQTQQQTTAINNAISSQTQQLLDRLYNNQVDNQQLTQQIISNQNANQQQAHQDSQEIKNTITNDNITSSDADDFKNNEAFSDSTGLESVINLPLNMVNSLSNECQPIQLHIPYLETDATIPCMSTIYRSKFNSLYTLVKLVVNGFLVYRILLKVYELVHEAKQPDEDKLEVIEL